MTCHCIELDERMKDGPGKPGAFSPESDWRAWYDREVSRLCTIGRARLLEWWEKTKHQTHPGTYGQTNHELASCVAYSLANGGITPAMREYEQSEDPACSWVWGAINTSIRRMSA